MTPRILIAGKDKQQRRWLRHHLQTLWPDADPPSFDLKQFAHHLDTVTRRNYDVVLLCTHFGKQRPRSPSRASNGCGNCAASAACRH